MTIRLALYQPDIPQNTGTILRLCACLGVATDLIAPAAFDLTDRALRRAGLDYLDHCIIARHESFERFYQDATSQARRVVLLTSRGTAAHHTFAFRSGDTLLLGRESAGVPESVHELIADRIRIPMQPGMRSLNIAVAAGIVLAEALRQTGGFAT